MYLVSKFKLKKFLITLLTFVMVVTLALATACSTSNDDDENENTETKTETTATDYQLIKNGDFEFSTKEDTKYPYSSSISWSKSTDSDNTSATSSKVDSGIIDTEDEAYAKLKDNEKPVVEGITNYNPRTPYYYGLTQNLFEEDNVNKRVNPKADGSKILMIANKTAEEGVGTAQKFKASSSISIPTDGYAVVSIWVKTVNLKSATLPEGEFGAYIQMTNKVGSTEYKDLCFDNINTKGNWTRFEFSIIGSDLATTTLTLTVGLGYGNGTFTKGYVEGYAYFDNVQVTTYNKVDYEKTQPDSNIIDITDVDKENIFDLGSETYATNPTEKSDYSEDKYNAASHKKQFNYRYSLGTATAITGGSAKFPDEIFANGYDLKKNNQIGSRILSELLPYYADEQLKEELATIREDIGTDDPYVIYMSFTTPSVASYLTKSLTIAPKTYSYYTFYANVIGKNDSDMGKVEIYDEVAKTYTAAFAAIDTSNVKDGNYGKWAKFSMLLYNPTDTDVNYKLKFTFGCDTIHLVEDQWKLQQGHAMFADLKCITLDKDTGFDVYNYISGDNVFKGSVYGKYSSYVEGDDSETLTTDGYNVFTDLQGAYDLQSKPVTTVKGFSFIGDDTKVTTGIINSKYINNDGTYGEFINESGVKEGYQINGLEVFKTLTDGNNKYAQAIVLDNREKTNSSYRSSKITLAPNTFKKITLNVKATGTATANIYLVDNTGNRLNLTSIDKELKATVQADTIATSDNWTQIAFYLASGNQALDLRLEIWNGNYEGEGSVGAIFFENVVSTELESETNFITDKSIYAEEFEQYSDKGYSFITRSHQRADATVIELVDGEEVTSTKKFQPKEVYAANTIVTFADFTTIHCDDVIDNTDVQEDTETEEEEDAYTVTTDAALQISTIAITITLLAAMVVVLVRKNSRKRKNKQVKINNYYNRDSREISMEKISSKKKSSINVEKDEEESEYNYDEAQEVEEAQITEITEETPSEEVTEETVEETVEETAEATEEKKD